MVVLRLIRTFRKMRSHRAFSFGAISLLLIISIVGNAACFYGFDHSHNPDLTIYDALWYSAISITTIGYGDYSAQSAGARIGTLFFIVVLGLGTFTVFVGLVIDSMARLASKGERGMGKAYSSEHIVIVHFPSITRVQQLIDEIQSDMEHHKREIVVISDQLERTPFSSDDILFIHGSSLSEDTYTRAGIDRAKIAIVLATGYEDPNSDAVVASAVSVIDNLNPDTHIVAECLNDEHRPLFKNVRCDAIVSGLRITGNLLVQESHDPGVSQMIDVITSNLKGDTMFSAEVDGQTCTQNYADLAKNLIDENINILAIVRRAETFTTFANVSPETGDRIIYLARQRLPWSTLIQKGCN